MILAYFEQIQSKFHPDSGPCDDDNRDKYRQLQYFIISFNAQVKIYFYLVPDVSFGKGGADMRL